MSLNLIAGSIIGAIYGLLIFVLHFAGILRTPLGGQLLFLAVVVQIVGLILALGRHRARAEAQGEEAPFARLFGSGLMISMVAGLILALSLIAFTTWVDPTYLDWVTEQARDDIAAQELTEELRQQQLQQLENVSPLSYGIQGMVGSLTTGFFLALMISAFLRLRILQPGSSSEG